MLAARTVAALHPAPHSCLLQVDDLVRVIYTQLMLVTRGSLRDILMQALLQIAQLHCKDVTTSLLCITITGDIDVALQLQGNPRTSESCPDKSCYGQDSPADSELRHHTTTEAMWNTLVCEASLLSRILKSLLLIQHTSMLLSNFGDKCNCHLLLTVSIQMRPGLPCPGLRTPLQLLLPSSSAPKPGPPKGCWGLQGYSQTGHHMQLGPAADWQAACPCCPWGSFPTSSHLGSQEAWGAEQAVGLVKVSAA